jgi:hypothetical protein
MGYSAISTDRMLGVFSLLHPGETMPNNVVPEETTSKTVEQKTFDSELKAYVEQIDSLIQSHMMSMFFNHVFGSKSEETLVKFEEANCTVKEIVNEDKGVTNRQVQIPIEHYTKWKKLKHRRDQSVLAVTLVPRSILVSLHSQFDAFVGNILRIVFSIKTELLNPSKREITFADLIQLGSIEEARNSIVNKEIECLLRKSRKEQFEWMEERFGTSFTKFDSWPTFIETSQRRNLYVHTDGIVSGQYLVECGKSNCRIDPNVKEGDVLNVTPHYFKEASFCILEVGVKLGHVLWRRYAPDQLEQSNKSLNWLCYELIERGDLDIAIILLKFAVDLPGRSSEASKLTFVINLAQAYKWHGKVDECEKVLNSRDWSAVGDNFKLAEAVLRDDWERAIQTMYRIGCEGDIEKIEYRDWPLFQQLRTRDDFLKAYADIFKEPFPISVESEEEQSVKQVTHNEVGILGPSVA